MTTWLRSKIFCARISMVCARSSRQSSSALSPLIVAVLLAGCSGSHVTDGGASEIDATGSDGAIADAMIAMDGGTSGCTSDVECDDGAACATDCTVDTCTIGSGSCRHAITLALCAAGESCNATTGCCEAGRPCATSADCEDDDPCTTSETCDPSARVCTHQPLDGDGDGDPPRVCGGGDCNDSDVAVFMGADEVCNGADEDCDSMIDEATAASALCGDRSLCVDAHCECRPEFVCPGSPPQCVDTQSDPEHCGACGRACASGEGCGAGACAPCDVPGGPCCRNERGFAYCDGNAMCDFETTSCIACAPGTLGCAEAGCVPVAEDERNCGACGTRCEVFLAGEAFTTLGLCREGMCEDCGRNGYPCCEGVRLCEGTLICRSATGTCGPR